MGLEGIRGLNEISSIGSGQNWVLEQAFGGNEEVYTTTGMLLDLLSMGYMQVGMDNIALDRNRSQKETNIKEKASWVNTEAAKKTGADRAVQYSSSWKEGSVKEAIKKFAPNATPVYTDKGKIIFRNDSTGIEVVYDKNGNYFRIIDTNLTGRRTALDLDGNKIPNNITTEKGTQRGMSQGEYNAASHFNNTDVDFNK